MLIIRAVSMTLNIIKPGTTPNVTMSAKLSRSFPMGDDTFNRRAVKPSKKSSTKAMPTK
jgi:hypothetical protein